MKNASLILFILFSICSAKSTAQTADEILDKHFKALGVDSLANVKTMTIEGRVTGTAIKSSYVGYTVKKERPYKQYLELYNKGAVSKTIFDGKTEWVISQGKTVKNPFDIQETRKRKICFEGDLYYCKHNGYNIEYKGIKKIDGLDFLTLKVSTKEGYEAEFYIDPGSYMLMKSVEGETATFYSNFKQVNGVTFAFSVRVSAIGSSQETELNIDSIEFNSKVPASLFDR